MVGSSGQGKVLIDAIEKINSDPDGTRQKYSIVGVIDDFRRPDEKVWEYPILGSIEDLPRLIDKYSAPGVVIGVGDNFSRFNISNKIKELCPTASFPSIVYPGAILGRGVSVGEGTFISSGVVISHSAAIGNFCMLNINAVVGHDCVMEDFASIASLSVFGAYGRLGFACAISMGVTLLAKTNVGEHAVVGAGSIVTRDIPAYVLAYGAPAKTIRDRKPGDKYLY